MIYTTLNKIREHSPCSDGWAKLLRHPPRHRPRCGRDWKE